MARGGRRKKSRGLHLILSSGASIVSTHPFLNRPGQQWRGSALVVWGVGAGVRGPSSVFGKSAPGTVMILVGSFEDRRRQTEIEKGRPPNVCHLSQDRHGSAAGAIVSIGLLRDGRRSRDQCDNDGETLQNCSAKKIDRDTPAFSRCAPLILPSVAPRATPNAGWRTTPASRRTTPPEGSAATSSPTTTSPT